MKISGFTLVRNGERFDYPYLESLRSLLPGVDELVINVGDGDDDTLARVREFGAREGQGKVVIFESRWPLDNPEKKKGGLILSEQTNLALDRCTGDWCVYLQADEVLHEADWARLREAISAADSDPAIDGILFDYLHFYGSFDVVQISRSAYRREVRAIRRASGARSIGDAQSFRKGGGVKLAVSRPSVRIFHYGWVRPPEKMREKTFHMDQLYHGGKTETMDSEGSPSATSGPFAGSKTGEDAASAVNTQPRTGDNYRYKRFWGLRRYDGPHPAVMAERIRSRGWHWNLATSPFEWTLADGKKIVLDLFERATGIRLFEYRSYRLAESRRSNTSPANTARTASDSAGANTLPANEKNPPPRAAR